MRTPIEASPVTRREREPDELLGDIPRRVRLPLDVTAQGALAAVLCTLTQHVSGEDDTRHLLDALPQRCRPPLERCAKHRNVETSSFTRDEMLRRVAEHLQVSRGDAEDITAAIMMAIGLRVRAEAMHQLADQVSPDLRDLWVVRRVASPLDPHPVFEEIERQVALPRGLTGLGAFTAVMSLLSRRFSRVDAHVLADNLPLDLRPLLAEARANRAEQPESFGREDLFGRVAIHLDVNEPEPVVRAVFRAVQPYLRGDVCERVARLLPPDLRELWLTP